MKRGEQRVQQIGNNDKLINMETIKLHVDNVTGEVYYSPNKEIETTIVEVEKMPKIEKKKLYLGILYYVGGKFETRFTVDNNQVYGAINGLKADLQKTDYQVIKNMEASICGYNKPYETSIYYERQSKRDDINNLENLLNK